MAEARTGKILIVEDDLIVARLQERRLALAGYAAVIATTSQAAFELIKQGGIELILLDYCLATDETGLDFYADLKAAGYQLPVIMVTAHSDEKTILRALRSGAQDFVTKSAEYLEYLPNAIERVLHKERLAKQLAESEALLAGIINSATDAIITLDSERRISLFNPAAERMFRLKASEALGQLIDRFVPMEASSGLAAGRDHVSGCNLHRGVRADGEEFPLEGSLAPVEANGRSFHTLVVRDITERKRAEERLREQATLIQAAQDAIVVLDMEDRIKFWNPSAARLYGWSESEALGRPAGELIHAHCTRDLNEARRILQSCGEWSGELKHVNKSGQRLIVESRWTLIPDDLGRPHSLLMVNTDVTEKKNLQSLICHAQRMESVGTLAGGVAHEFNNLLQSIRGYTQYGMQGLDPDDQRLQDLEQVLSAADRASTLTRQLLSFSRRQRLERQEVDPNQMIDELVQMLRPLMGAAIELQHQLGDDVPRINVDCSELQQVLTNLCMNARDAMPQGGRLLISIERVALSTAYCQAHPDVKPGAYVLFTVTDTGHGMPEELRQRIFEPFFTTKEVGQGNGLGLAIAYGIVRQHDGCIQVESSPTKGSSFKVFIPAIEEQPEADLEEAMAHPTSNELILNREKQCLVQPTTA